MSSDGFIISHPLAGGLTVTLRDATRHYFGGYYHVRIEVAVPVTLDSAMFPETSEYEDALRRLGPVATFSRVLEKMAVPQAELEPVKQQLLSSFDNNLLPYLRREDFAASFVRNEYRSTLKNSPRYPQ